MHSRTFPHPTESSLLIDIDLAHRCASFVETVFSVKRKEKITVFPEKTLHEKVAISGEDYLVLLSLDYSFSCFQLCLPTLEKISRIRHLRLDRTF